jgi:hypothetical protein
MKACLSNNRYTDNVHGSDKENTIKRSTHSLTDDSKEVAVLGNTGNTK